MTGGISKLIGHLHASAGIAASQPFLPIALRERDEPVASTHRKGWGLAWCSAWSSRCSSGFLSSAERRPRSSASLSSARTPTVARLYRPRIGFLPPLPYSPMAALRALRYHPWARLCLQTSAPGATAFPGSVSGMTLVSWRVPCKSTSSSSSSSWSAATC